MSKLKGWIIPFVCSSLVAWIAFDKLRELAWVKTFLISIVCGVATKIAIAFITNPKEFIARFRPGVLLSRLVVEWYLGNPSSFRFDCMSRVIERIYFRQGVVNRVDLEGASPIIAAGLILALQRRSGVIGADGLDFPDARSLARSAAKCASYRKYLLDNAAEDLPSTAKLRDQCTKAGSYAIGDELRNKSDEELINRIGDSNDEVVRLFATTGQLTKEFEYLLNRVIANVRELHLYICSPLVITHSSLLRLEEEYENPVFCTSFGQLVTADDGKIFTEGDCIRRVISILGLLDSFQRIAGVDRLKIYFFKDRYPGVKVRLLERNAYVQVQPGSLTYQNNLYRFGLESTSSDIARALGVDLNQMLLNGKIEEAEASREGLDHLRRRSICELSIHLLARGASEASVGAAIPRIMAMAKLPSSERFMRDLTFRLRGLESVARGRRSLAELTLADYTAHISVGMIIVDSGKLALIKKADNFYDGKYSIVAGHVENEESPGQALVRECTEELGIAPETVKLMMAPFLLDDRCRHGGEHHMWFLFECTINKAALSIDATEIEHLQWVPVSELQSWKSHLTTGAEGALRKAGYVS